jgi:hypothetical protein
MLVPVPRITPAKRVSLGALTRSTGLAVYRFGAFLQAAQEELIAALPQLPLNYRSYGRMASDHSQVTRI